MADSKLKLTGDFQAGKNYLLKGETLLAWQKALLADRAIPGPGLTESQGPDGRTFTAIAGIGGNNGPCPFGEMIDIPDDGKAINGGIVFCGDKNFFVPYYTIDLGTDGDFILYLELACEANRDDDEEIFLPGIKTSSETTPSTFWTLSTDASYSDNILPDVSDGIGNMIVPIGSLTVAEGVATFGPTGCGNVFIGQCGGTLTHSRA